MLPHFTSAVVATTLLVTQAAAKGLNCKGSFFCSNSDTNHAVRKIASFINEDIEHCRTYFKGTHVACVSDSNIFDSNGGFCAFIQKTDEGLSGTELQELITKLADRTDDTCNNCGSIPIMMLDSNGNKNDSKKGILTVNFVSNTDNPCPNGVCP
ncbi:killer toxin [Xylariomycetidae sp. FL2044]|nr:killer toxin [Xylariomycetidae sp. FL2044]